MDVQFAEVKQSKYLANQDVMNIIDKFQDVLLFYFFLAMLVLVMYEYPVVSKKKKS